jgi:hypothetical protein
MVNVAFDEAISYMRQKINLPTKTWRDIEGRSHDRAFVVAGATKDALLSDLRFEIEKAVAGGLTLSEFRKNFDQIVAKNGWTGFKGDGSDAGIAWRTKMIFETNLKTAYAAGRYKQMTDPDVTKLHKYWRYRHGFYREPEQARVEHKNWDNLVLPYNDPFWSTHYPPNGWHCSCGIETVTERELKKLGIKVDQSPVVAMRTVIDPKTNDTVRVPNGIDFGWDHAPGKDWATGVVPRELQETLLAPIAMRKPVSLPSLAPIAKPFKAKPLPAGTDAMVAAESFLSAFGADMTNSVLFRDVSGHVIVISKDLFVRGDGTFKADKRDRHLDFPMLSEAVIDPDEIWVDWAQRRDNGAWFLVRRYIRAAQNGLGFASFNWSTQGWTGATMFSPTKGDGMKRNDDYLENMRNGALLWRREK